jgi:hypothetical protein
MGRVSSVIVLLLVVGAERPARADVGDLVQGSADAAIQRTRRSLALGPTVGVAGAYAIGPDRADAPVTFGLAFRKFKIPWMPERDDVVKSIRDRGVVETGKDVLGQLTGRRPRPPKTLEKPSMAITVEGARFLDSGDWQVRAAVGIGISKITIGPALSGHIGDADGLLVGGELGLHLTPWKGVRSPVVDVYLRGELGVTSQLDDTDIVSLGTRFLYDLI